MGAQLVKEAASKTNDVAGDGTTTSTVLAQAIVNQGLQNVTAGANPMIVRKGLEKALATAIEELDSMKSDIKHDDRESIEKVATISAADEKIGKEIADALVKVGRNGLITAEEGKGLSLETKETSGMEFDNGFLFTLFRYRYRKWRRSSTILTSSSPTKISSIQDILPFLEKLVKLTKNFVIISEDIDGEALATLVVNKLRGTFNVLAVKAPGFGDVVKPCLKISLS